MLSSAVLEKDERSRKTKATGVCFSVWGGFARILEISSTWERRRRKKYETGDDKLGLGRVIFNLRGCRSGGVVVLEWSEKEAWGGEGRI